eukprot:4758354-Amphidinium_carterae.1
MLPRPQSQYTGGPKAERATITIVNALSTQARNPACGQSLQKTLECSCSGASSPFQARERPLTCPVISACWRMCRGRVLV